MDAADLHLHSDRSDGELPPAELVGEARRAGLRAIALTDHDTVAGVEEAVREGEEQGIEVIAGVEISAWDGVDWHVLGYGFDPCDGALVRLFARAGSARRDRAERIVERLGELGCPVSLQAVLDEAGPGAVGRPHVARVLLRAGHVRSIREAFDLYLADGRPACVEKMRVRPAQAIDLLHRAGGAAVAAHPGVYGDAEALDELVAAGLDGVEVDHALHDEETARRLAEYAAERGLVRTGGSDFHGPGFGSGGVGAVRIPYERVEELHERIARRRREASRLRAAGAGGGG